MTREEAARIIKECKDKGFKHTFYTLNEYHMALDMAIKALEQEPCEDAISREMALKECHDIVIDGERYRIIQEETLLGLPPVNPQQKTGHWVEENINEWSRKVFCSECGCPPPFEHISNGDIYSASGYGVNNKTKFCPNCGARMERSDKE